MGGCTSIADNAKEKVMEITGMGPPKSDYTGYMSRWMSETADKIRDVKLKDLRIPGTHDSFTCSISAPIASGWMVCQDTHVNQQLAFGVRYFDCRVRSVDGVFWTHHGLKSDKFEPILREMRAFLDHDGCDKEILIVDMSHFEDFKSNDGPRLRQLVADLFGDKLVPKSVNLDEVTVNDIWATPGRVIALFDANEADGQMVLADECEGKEHPCTYGFGYRSGDDSYFLSFNKQSREWVTRAINTANKLGPKVHGGTWDKSYDIMTPFSVDGRHYFIASDVDTLTWMAHELLPDGNIGTETARGKWPHAFTTLCPFFAEGRPLLFAAATKAGTEWGIFELLPGGLVGGEIAEGQWGETYTVQFPYVADNRIFQWRYNQTTNKYAIQEMHATGQLGEQMSAGEMPKRSDMQYPAVVDGRSFVIGLNKAERYWIVYELKGDGTLGDEQITGFLPETAGFAVANSHRSPIVMHQLEDSWLVRTLRRVEAPHVWTKQHRGQCFSSFWPNKGDMASLVEANKAILEQTVPQRAANKLFVLQCQITAPEDTFVQWLMAHKLSTLTDFAKDVNTHYKKWFREEVDPATTRINIVIADFVDEDYCRAVIHPYLPKA